MMYQCHILLGGSHVQNNQTLLAGRRSQAVRLPKEFRMMDAEVHIRGLGAAVVLEPVASGWEWLDVIAGEFSGDFFAAGRNQPERS